MRTREQIIADLEARYAELEAEAGRRRENYDRRCWDCRFFSCVGTDGYVWKSTEYVRVNGTCTNALVQGFERYGKRAATNPMPCGPEKALWQPKPTLRERITEWLKGLFE